MTKNLNATKSVAYDPFFPSGRFAQVPAEALAPSAHSGETAMSHAEFRVFVALCRFRGAERSVHPTRETLGKMTGLTNSNVSRATKRLQDKGWLTIHYEEGKKCRVVKNYALTVSTGPRAPGESLTARHSMGKGTEVSETALGGLGEDIQDEPWVVCLSEAELEALVATELEL